MFQSTAFLLAGGYLLVATLRCQSEGSILVSHRHIHDARRYLISICSEGHFDASPPLQTKHPSPATPTAKLLGVPVPRLCGWGLGGIRGMGLGWRICLLQSLWRSR